MKKTIIMAAAIALTLASCGSKTQSNAAGADSAAVENVETAAGEAEDAAETALSEDSKATVENLGAELKKAIEAKDSKAAITTLANLQTVYKNLVAAGKLDEAKAYGESIKQLVSENADAIKNVANGNVTISQLVEGVTNLPTSASTTAEQAKAAIGSDIVNLASPTIAKGETAVKTAEAAAEIVKNAPEAVKTAAASAASQAVTGAKEKANEAVSNAKETAKAAAEKKVNEAKEKANNAVNDAASKALNKLLK